MYRAGPEVSCIAILMRGRWQYVLVLQTFPYGLAFYNKSSRSQGPNVVFLLGPRSRVPSAENESVRTRHAYLNEEGTLLLSRPHFDFHMHLHATLLAFVISFQ